MEEKGERFEEGILMEAFGPEPLEKTGLKDMGKFICRVNGNLTGTGFFCKIPYKNRIFYTLITNYHIIDDNFLENNEYLTLYIDIDKRKSIDISINRKIYSSIINKYDIMILKLEKKDGIDNFLELDRSIFEFDSEKTYKNEPIYILHYPNAGKACVSYGKGIEKENEFDIKHNCNTEIGSSGAPILTKLNNTVIGIHKAFIQKRSGNFNIGTFLKFPLNELSQIKISKILSSNRMSKGTSILYKGLKKLLKRRRNYGFFRILCFLNNNEISNLLKTDVNLISLINKSIADTYFFTIKDILIKYKKIFELLKCSLIYTKLENKFKINFQINIRFLEPNKTTDSQNQDELAPKYYQLLFFYKPYRTLEPNTILKAKKNTKKIKMYDYYSFDLYPNGYKFPSVFISKEFQNIKYGQDIKENYTSIQPILPFKYNDKAIINFEIYNNQNNFIVPDSIEIILKCFELKSYIEKLDRNALKNMRYCEHEYIYSWKDIKYQKDQNLFENIKKIIKDVFDKFSIESISFVNANFFLYKIILIATNPSIIDIEKFGIDFRVKLIVKRQYENIENEIKKNNLLIENKKQILELRVGDKIIIYIPKAFLISKANKY